MKPFAWSILAGAILLAGCGGSGTDNRPFSAEKLAEVDSAINSLIADGATPGVIVRVTSPQGNLTKAYGVADTATEAPMQTDMHFRMGSVTKTFTAGLVLLLAQEGKLSLDDPISKYVSGVPKGDQITLRMLGCMSSGLPSYTKNEDFVNTMMSDWSRTWTPEELLAYAFSMEQSFDPNQGYEYSNTNTVLLGLVVQAVDKRTFAESLQARITGPLGLANVSWPVDGTMPSPASHGYSIQNLEETVQDATNYNPSWGFTAGQMIGTIDEVDTWIRAYGAGTIFNSAINETRFRYPNVASNSPSRNYAFALININGWVGHNGDLPGYSSFAMYNPATRSSIVVSCNTDTEFEKLSAAGQVLNRVSSILLPGHATDIPPHP